MRPLLDLLLRSSIFLALILAVALPLATLVLRRQPTARHAVLLAALTLGALAPLWLSLSPPGRASSGGRAGAVDVPDPVAAPVIERAARAASPEAAGPVLAVWALGVALFGLRLVRSWRRTHQLRRRARPLGDGEASGVRSTARILVSGEVTAALVAGVRRPAIVLAPALLDSPALASVLAHEEAHLRRRDTLWAVLQRAIAAAYWFHPAVHLVNAAIARACEEACDDHVVAAHDRSAYARTLLALASAPADGPWGLDAALGRRRSALESRIRRLLAARPAGRAWPWALALTVALVALVALGGGLARALVPLSAPAVERPADAEERRLFDQAGPGAQGAFVLMDLRRSTVLAVGPASERVTPASTFKVIVALAALDSGILADEHQVLPWDGQRAEIESWNRNHDLASAMRTSANWFFEELLRRLPAGRIEKAVAGVGYGNGITAGDRVRFWVEGDLRISALEQARIMARLATGALPFEPRSQQIVRAITTLDTRGRAVLHGKTGTAILGDQMISWLVGYVEDGQPTHAFATLIRAPATGLARVQAKRMDIARALLGRQGAF